MATKRLTDDDLKAALLTLETHGSMSAAAIAVGLPTATFKSRVLAARERLGVLPSPAPMSPPPPPIRDPLGLPFEDAWANWMRAVGMAKDRYSKPLTRSRTGDTTKFLVVPDLHVPFHEPDMLAATLEREADADHVICIGDLGDAYALSRFLKYERMPYREEWAAVTLVMQELASRFQKVTVVIGNHDARLEKQIRLHLTEDMVDAIQCLTGGTLCPLTALAKRYPNVEIAKHETPSGRTVDWFTMIGDAWLGHPEKFSNVPVSALRAVDEWITDNEMALGLERCRLIVLGHTHQMSLAPWKSERLLVECGCLCQQQGYMLSPRIGGRPQRRGYVTFEQTEGRTDLNSVRLTWFDVMDRAA